MDNQTENSQPLVAGEKTCNSGMHASDGNNNLGKTKTVDICHSVWPYTTSFALANVFGLLGLYMILSGEVLTATTVFAFVLGEVGLFGILAGAHRYWAHRCFTANAPFRLLLGITFFLSGQHTIWRWVAWHRVHHKFLDTEADPYNSNRGVFYSHFGWFWLHDYKKFRKNVSKIDMSDIERDPIVSFNERYSIPILVFFNLILPTFIPWCFYEETFFNSFCVGACLRFAYLAYKTPLVITAGRVYALVLGTMPWFSSSKRSETECVSMFTHAEGMRSHHHAYPWDYKGCELGFYRWNATTVLLDFFAWIGWARDLKSVPQEVAMQTIRQIGNQLQYVTEGREDTNNIRGSVEIHYPGKHE